MQDVGRNAPQGVKHLLGADFVRTGACLVVLFHHLVQQMGPGSLAETGVAKVMSHAGMLGVGLFFVLSGFLLARPFWQALDQNRPMPSLRVYLLRRAARILPGFWLALTLSFILSILVWNAIPDVWLWIRYLSGVFLVSDWHWLTLFPVEVNPPLWSIGFEVSSYVFLPLGFLLVFAFGKHLPSWMNRLSFVAVIALAFAAHIAFTRLVVVDPFQKGWQFGLQGGAKEWMPAFNPFAFFAMFAVGALAAGVQMMIARFRHWSMDLIFVAAILALGVRETGAYYGWLPVANRFPIMHALGATLLVAGPSTVIVGRLLDNALVRFLAQISFGIYIYHMLVIELLKRFAFGNVTSASMGDGTWLALACATCVITFAAAAASYRWLEEPVIKWARSLETSAPKLGAAQTA